MAFTTHGHHIADTETGTQPSHRVRCGGPGICPICSREAAAYKKLDVVPLPDIYTDAEALKDLTNWVAAFTSGVKGAIAESEDQDLAQEALQFIEASIQRRN